MRDFIYENTLQAMTCLIENSLEVQRTTGYVDLTKISPRARLKEFCTVKVGGPRRSGHTTAIKTLAKNFKDPLVICFNHDMKESQFPEIKGASIHSLDRLRGISTEIVFVDCASLLSHRNKEEIYDLCMGFMVSQKRFCLVFVE